MRQQQLQQMRMMGMDVDESAVAAGPTPPTAADALVLPENVPVLADAYPFEPTADHVSALGKLLAALARADATATVAADLERGRGRFGGKAPADRRRAATLLLEAKLNAQANKFLPSFDPATPPAADERGPLEDKIRALIADGDQGVRRGTTQEEKEAAELRRIYEMNGYSASLVPAVPQAAKAYAPQHAEALMLSGRLASLPGSTPAMREAAVDRAIMALLHKVEPAVGQAFLARLLAGRPEEAGAVVSAVAAAAQRASANNNTGDAIGRTTALATQARIADWALGRAASATPPAVVAGTSATTPVTATTPAATAATLDVLAANWLAEARTTESQPSAKEAARSGGRRLIRLPDGGMTYFSIGTSRGLGTAVVPDADLLASGPHRGDGMWLAACSPSLRPALVRSAAVLLTRDEQIPEAMDWIERLAPSDPPAAKQGVTWPVELAGAAATFDWNEFRYGRGLPLAEYTKRRDAVVARFAVAADAYAVAFKAGAIPLNVETVNRHMGWFLAALGASDLAQLTRQQTPQLSQVELVKRALAALPAGAAARHLDAFATALVEQSKTVNPELKYRYLKAGLTVVGTDHPKAAAAADMVKYYGELLGELEVVAKLDGASTAVGRQPLGVHFGVRHTALLGRESGGFGRYLVRPNAAANLDAMMATQNQVKNDRDRVGKNLREAMSDAFEIVSVTWHAADVEPRGDPAGRPGWRYTPLAFLLLKAKDASADRLPPVRMDLDFKDATGRVVLPVESSVLAIDARSEPAAGGADLANVSVAQTLDESKLAEGQLSLDVRATADGLLPVLAKLVDLTVLAPWSVQKSTDGALAVGGLESKGERVRPQSTRSWTLTLRRLQDADAGASAAQFRFPPPLPGVPLAAAGGGGRTGGATYQRYAGTDLVPVGQTIELKAVPGVAGNPWVWATTGTAILLVVNGAVVGVRRWRRAAARPADLRIPHDLTPFSLVALLRRIEQSGGQNGDLRSEIKRLEQAYFSPAASSAADSDDLHRIARKWVGV